VIIYKKFRTMKINPVKINVKKWTIGNCKISTNLIVLIETSIRMSYSCYRPLLHLVKVAWIYSF